MAEETKTQTLEKRIERLENRLSRISSETKEQSLETQKNISRRDFLKKAGLGTAGLAALMSPVSARFLVKDEDFSVQTSNDGGNTLVEGLFIDQNQNVKIPNGNLNIQGNTAFHAGNDGEGSGLDADTLDGNHSSEFIKESESTQESSTQDDLSDVTHYTDRVAGSSLTLVNITGQSGTFVNGWAQSNGPSGTIDITIDGSTTQSFPLVVFAVNNGDNQRYQTIPNISFNNSITIQISLDNSGSISAGGYIIN